MLEMARTIGDMIVASNSANLPFVILGKRFSDHWVAIGGIVASVVNGSQTWMGLYRNQYDSVV